MSHKLKHTASCLHAQETDFRYCDISWNIQQVACMCKIWFADNVTQAEASTASILEEEKDSSMLQ